MPRKEGALAAVSMLKEIGMNLWFSWNHEAQQLFHDIDADLWYKTSANPLLFLQKLPADRLDRFLADEQFRARINLVYEQMQNYLSVDHTYFQTHTHTSYDGYIIYFSAEFGIHESFPNYAGGLGILAGDHCKSASDLGIPLIGMGLLYKYAYFRQRIDASGNQLELYEEILSHNQESGELQLPLRPVLKENGEPLLVSVLLKDKEVFARIWELRVGRNKLFLLDTDVEINIEDDRKITSTLYVKDRETRLKQEIILGIGGIRALEAMQIPAFAFHMNEGHSAFSGLERLRILMNNGMTFEEALDRVRNSTLFTTHTPVAAGNEAFEFDLIRTYFTSFWEEMGISEEEFLNLGRNRNEYGHENFSLTVLALNLSAQANGVSAIHGRVSREMWTDVFNTIDPEEVPITHITNGIHTTTWLHPRLGELFHDFLGADWAEHLLDVSYWDRIEAIPDEAFWQIHTEIKHSIMEFLRNRYRERLQRYQGLSHNWPSAEEILNPRILTIGFARRFTTYKRGTLIFHDPGRLHALLQNSERPIQILFAGKAHPADEPGKALIRTVNRFAREEGFRGNIIFLEDYSIQIARALVAGCDVWLNTPRKPLEASGTSGQKAAINGVLNLSIADGWWPEAFNHQNGWVIGDDIIYEDKNLQDYHDAESLYRLLEEEIIPLYYERDEQGIPRRWLKMLKAAIRSTIHRFSTHRMVWEYWQKFYRPMAERRVYFNMRTEESKGMS